MLIVQRPGTVRGTEPDGLTGTLEASQASTSGTAIDFTGLSIGDARRVTVMLDGVSLSGTDNLLVQIGDSGGIEATGYVSTSGSIQTTPAIVNSTTGFIIYAAGAGQAVIGHIVLTLRDFSANTWISSHHARVGAVVATVGGGSKSLTASLDRVRITRTGTDTFDAGSINVLVE